MKKLKPNKLPPQKLIERALKDQNLRINLIRQNPLWFFAIYFPHYITYPIADFQREMFDIIQDNSIKQSVIVSFRGSAKSTIMTLCYTLWAVLGVQQKKFIVLISQTQDLAKQHLKNLKNELAENKLLRADLGPFQSDDEWSAGSIVIPKYGTRITAASTEQGIRGIKHGPHRPDLIIADDIEDLNSVKTSEGRQKTYDWFNGEIVPLGNQNTRIIIIGNLLHEDSLIMRLRQEIDSGARKGIFRSYPIIDEEENILWPGKYPKLESIEVEKQKIDKFSFAREYMLQIIDNQEAVVNKEDLLFYENIPEQEKYQTRFYAIGVDLAISERIEANYTALVSAIVIGSNEKRKIYILPNSINKKMRFPTTLATIEILVNSYGNKYSTDVFVEDVMLQRALSQQLNEKGIRSKGVKIGRMDKKMRLMMTSELIQRGRILFPLTGSEPLIKQILNLGLEKHDDLVDAFTILVLGLLENPSKQQVYFFPLGNFYKR